MDFLTAVNSSNCNKIEFFHKKAAIRIVSGLSCIGSILGSVLIILSYLCFRKLRTRVRLILFHLSIADLGVALANLLGVSVYFDQYYTPICGKDGHIVSISPPTGVIRHSCEAQAFIALYFTISSILWTISLAGYLYFVVVHHGTQHAKIFLIFSYTFCYGMPAFVTLWTLLRGKLGYSPYNSAGWCTMILVNPVTKSRDVYMGVMGYDLWIYLALVLVPVLYLSMKFFLRDEFHRTKDFVSKDRFWKAVYVLEYKLLSIPIAFFLLRMWTCIINLLYVYIDEGHEIPKGVLILLIYLSGIGDSGQGLVNAVLFVVLTKQVRDSFLQLCSCWKKGSCTVDQPPPKQCMDNRDPESPSNSDNFTPINH